MYRWSKVGVFVLLVLVAAASMRNSTVNAGVAPSATIMQLSSGPVPPTPWKLSSGPVPPTPWKLSSGPVPPTPWRSQK
jgi:hypothetical protein